MIVGDNMKKNIVIVLLVMIFLVSGCENTSVKVYRERSNDKPIVETNSAYTKDDFISYDDATDIALNRANLTKTEVSFLRTELEYDDRIHVYDVDFKYNGKEYSYEIDAVTGEILSEEVEIDD